MMITMKVDVVVIQLASKLGIGKLWVKDESYRFNLKAFKVKAFLGLVFVFLASQDALEVMFVSD